MIFILKMRRRRRWVDIIPGPVSPLLAKTEEADFRCR